MQRRQVLAVSGAGLSASVLAGWFTLGPSGADDEPAPATVESLDVEQTDQRTLTVDGSGAVSAEPDRAQLSVTVEATDDEAAAVVAELAERSETLRADLRAADIDGDAITTAGYSLRESSRRSQYEGQHRFAIALADHERVGEIIDVVAASTADEITRVSFTLSEHRRDELYHDAVEAAVDDARAEADLYADAAAVTVEDPVDIETTQTRISPFEQRLGLEAAAADDAATELEAGDVSVTASVTITYEFSPE